ncbi:unnamed protein product [Thelazia callipaeda]|uniref:MMPL domain-containing protein n=1 Tax=Thelazia callipaeda TaxID=103827 RepID=A0A0N5CSD1_THECL|nr:unnamed protein product [Thelazia callipaeda]
MNQNENNAFVMIWDKMDSRERLEEALLAIGWPMLQVGISTVLALLPLLMKQSYLSMVFLKTVTITTCLGIFHAFVVLPALLTTIDFYLQGYSSHRSHERKKNYYKSQQIMTKPKNEGDKTWYEPKEIPTSYEVKEQKKVKVVPISKVDMRHATPPLAYIHNIELDGTLSGIFQQC